jgi:O-antigen/teichoic acid export membrane protein
LNTVRRIAKNTGILFFSQIVSYIFGFFYIMYAARYLGAEGFGTLSFALAFTGIFGIFSDLGLRNLTVREVARNKSLAGKYLGNIVIIKIFLGIITFGLIAVTINYLSYPEQTIKVVYLVAFSVLFSTFSGMFYSIFQAYEKMEYQSLGQILSSVLMFVGALFAISKQFDIIEFVSIYFVVNAIIVGYAFAVCSWKFVFPKIEIDWDFWMSTIKEALPFGFTGIFVMIYYYIDTIMLSLMVPNANEVIGWYNAAYRLVLILLFIPSVYFASVFPVMSRFFKSSKESLIFTFERSIKYMLMVTFPIGVGTTLLADRIILLVFGSEFKPATIALQILVWSSVFIFVSQPFGNLVNSINRQIVEMKITAMGAVLNVVLNFILIPKFSYIAASATTVATELFVVLAYLFALLRTEYRLQSGFVQNIGSKVVISSLVMGGFIKYFERNNLLLLIVSSVLIYFGVFFITKGFDEKDIHILKNFIKERKLCGENEKIKSS